jgi:tetratricopeptide (TPR) repeat protein
MVAERASNPTFDGIIPYLQIVPNFKIVVSRRVMTMQMAFEVLWSPLLAIVLMISFSASSSRPAVAELIETVIETDLGQEDGDAWVTDAKTAIARAAAEKKDLLLLYTGSDWCPPCKKLEEEVLSQADFLKSAAEKFVMVMFDFPQEKVIPKELQDQNRAWAEKFGVSGYPTVILTDSLLRPYGITGYQEGGAESYLQLLDDLYQRRVRRDEALAKAETLTGDERAKMLDFALSEIDKELVALYYQPLVEEIVKIDHKDRFGLRTKWNEEKDAELRKLVMTDIAVICRLHSPEKAIAFIDEVIQEILFPPPQLLQVYQIKLSLLRKVGDREGMDKLLDTMIAMPELTSNSRQRLIVKKVLLMAGTERREDGLKFLDNTISTAAINESAVLRLARGQLLAASGSYEAAIDSFDQAIEASANDPELLIELYGAKADALMASGDELRALQVLDEVEGIKSIPSDLKAEALLQKAMILRNSGRDRRAILAENRAIESSENPRQRAEIQKLVDQLRSKFGR